MDNIILCSVLAFVITYFTIPVIIKIALEKHLFDEPDERKVHKGVIPTMGGLAIFAGLTLACLLGVQFAVAPEFQYIIGALLIMFFIGIKDDILVISASKKFIAQLIATSLIVYFGQIELNNLYGFLGITDIHPAASFILSLVAIIGITNAINLIDGIDGLAGSVGLVICLILGAYFISIGNISYSVFAFSMASALLGFLIYNFSPAKIFMGDTGSLLLGVVVSILVIKFINIEGLNQHYLPSASAPVVGFAILMVPIFDTLRVFGRRILNRKSPFSPDRTHLHHYLLDMGLNHRQIAISCAVATLVFSGVAYLLRDINPLVNLLVLFALALATTAYIVSARKRKLPLKAKIEEEETIDFIPSNITPNVVSIGAEHKLVEATD